MPHSILQFRMIRIEQLFVQPDRVSVFGRAKLKRGAVRFLGKNPGVVKGLSKFNAEEAPNPYASNSVCASPLCV